MSRLERVTRLTHHYYCSCPTNIKNPTSTRNVVYHYLYIERVFLGESVVQFATPLHYVALATPSKHRGIKNVGRRNPWSILKMVDSITLEGYP